MSTRREVLQWLLSVTAATGVPLIVGAGCDKVVSPPTHPTTPGKVTPPTKTATKSIVVPKAKLQKLLQNITIRKSEERGSFNHGWLQTKHSFSFARYYDPKHMGFRSLRVINEDVIAPGRGFPMHPHRDMEIITYILDGALRHRDSLNNGSIIRPGEIQRMTAGQGIRHSEFNPSGIRPVHLLQIWLHPDKQGYKPGYAQQVIPRTSSPDPVRLIASPTGENGSISIRQDVKLYACQLASRQRLMFEVKPKRHLWMQIAKGQISMNGRVLKAGDALSSSDDGWLEAYALEKTEILLFDLA